MAPCLSPLRVQHRSPWLFPSAHCPVAIHSGTKLRVFGSSANNFGNDEADLDMCLSFPKGSSAALLHEHSPADIIALLAEKLTELGMTEVGGWVRGREQQQHVTSRSQHLTGSSAPCSS